MKRSGSQRSGRRCCASGSRPGEETGADHDGLVDGPGRAGRVRPARGHPGLASGWCSALWLARQLARLLVWIIRTPSAAATVAVTTAIWLGWHYVHPALPLGVLGGLLAGLVVWRVRWPVTFEAQVRLRVRSWWRAGFVYRRQWATAMDTAGLLVERRRHRLHPALLGVRSTRTVDRVRVRMLPGQRVEDYAQVADRLAQTFGAQDCRVRSVRKRRHLVELWFLVNDPLEAVVRPLDAARTRSPPASRSRWPRTAPCSGSSWSAPTSCVSARPGPGRVGAVRDHRQPGPVRLGRLVNIWAVDPKGGMELAPAAGSSPGSPAATARQPAATKPPLRSCSRMPSR